MVRIGISVEGLTEEIFVKSVLAPYLAKKEIYVFPVSMGGAVNVDRVKNELKKIANSFDFVTTLYDFYRFGKKCPDEDKAALENRILKAVHKNVRAKLVPYIQMYEFEGLLFSSPDAIASGLQNLENKDWATGILKEFQGNPEAINDSPQTAPFKRLEANTAYKKTIHGPNIAKEIGIDKIREMCSGFDQWLSKLEGLG